MSSFLDQFWTILANIISWVKQSAVLIRTNPFLLFTVGFFVLGSVIMILGRLLNNE